MSTLKMIMMDLIITITYEVKKHKDSIIAVLLGVLIGKLI